MTTTDQNNTPAPVKILIVDDDPLVLELLGISINSFGFEHVAANNGREALKILKQQEFTIVITDMMMPEVDGMQLLEHVTSTHPQTAVIVVTGYTGTFSYMDVIRAGASDFISKPFNSDELEAKINRILREYKLINKLERLSNCDPLTELYNRRFLNNRAKEEFYRADRQGYDIFLIMLDVDNFKSFNDQYGHQEGDNVLIKLSEILRQSTRTDVDLVFRYGGDEFAIITPYISREQIGMVADRIIASFNEQNFAETGISLGIAEFKRGNDDLGQEITALFKRADLALYKAKEHGGNRTVFAEN
ncbi:MAG: diguanylate cyclase [Thermodesulfobacteriota bacterium]